MTQWGWGRRRVREARVKVEVRLRKDAGEFVGGLVESGNCSLNNFGEG